MSEHSLTRDNPLLSRPKTTAATDAFASPSSANRCQKGSEIDFTDLPARVHDYIEQALSANTKRAYLSDLRRFEAWGGLIPATDRMIAEYLADHADTHAPATLIRWLAAISKAHTSKGIRSPVASDLTKATLRGIRRARGTAQKEAKPILREDLFAMLQFMGSRPKDIRDKALLLVGFAGALRRSELVGLDYADIAHVRNGIVMHLRRSKTDQEGSGRKIGVPYGRTHWCPVRSLSEWLELSGIVEGPIFRVIDRHGHIAGHHLSGEAVSLVVKERLFKAGIDPAGYSGHSLRAGFVTSAAMAGASTWKIRAQTGHASDTMLNRYVRDGDIFNDNAAGILL